MDVMQINHYSHMELCFGNDGLRFLLDDMSVEVNGVVYSSDMVKEAIHQGNLAYYDCCEQNELTQAEMDTLLANASERGLSIIPLLNSPGHMNALLYAMQYLGMEDVAYQTSKTTLNLSNETAVAFTTKIIEKYIAYFASKGVEIFNLGTDEYANDIHKGFGNLISEGTYGTFISYVNYLANVVKKYGMVPMAFNDGFYYNDHTTSGTFDTDILIAYWHSGWSQYQLRSSYNLANDGFKLINTNANWYFVLGNPYPSYTYWTAINGIENKDCYTLHDQSGAPVNGAMLCFWCDIPKNPYVEITKERLFDLIARLANKNNAVFGLEDEENVVIDNDQRFMANWKFTYGEVSDGASLSLDDTSWQTVKVPHDYSSYLDYTNDRETEAESGYLKGGVGWYRKHFFIPEENRNQVIQIHFGGVYMNATIYINGHELGNHPYGYTPFSFDLSPYINYGGENVLAVRVNDQLSTSRWYSGSGIIRDVKLSIQNQTYIPENGIKVDTSAIDTTKVHTTIQTNTKQDVVVVQTLYDESYNFIRNEEEAFHLEEGQNTIVQEINSSDVQLWSIDSPNLYQLRTDIICKGTVIDSKWNTIGYRTYSFDPNNGFFLNGENIKLKGVCLHSDFGALGTAVNKSALRRQLSMMKQMGANAIKICHNPGNHQIYELCDEMGFVVIEEAFDGWHIAKNYNYQGYNKYFNTIISENNEILNKKEGMIWAEFDVKQIVLNSRNHPSLIMYSLGNEILEGLVSYTDTDSYIEITNNLIQWIKEVDINHVITINENNAPERLNLRPLQNQLNEIVVEAGGVIGLNYAGHQKYEQVHNSFPSYPLYASEVSSVTSTREYYGSKNANETYYEKSRKK